jgi:subtilisin family serine protease
MFNNFIGAEYTREQINQALTSEDPYSVVPEKDTVGHGTFLASIAAGSRVNGFTGAAPDADLIVVKLRKASPYYLDKYCVPKNQENAFSSADVMTGIQYIIDKSNELGKPVVICLGLGTNFAAHNGFSIFEQYITHIASQIGVCVCIATGNESQACHHFSGKLNQNGDFQEVQFTVGNNVGCVYMTMWNNISDRLSVSITSPTGEKIDKIRAKSSSRYATRLFGDSSVTVEYYFPIRVTGGQNTDIRIHDPSPGTWTLTVYGDAVGIGDYHIYLPITGFVDPSVKFLSPDPYYTTTIPATAMGIINCGAYNVRDNTLYSASSWGPTRLYLIAPDFAAPGVEVGGVYPDGFGVMSGTSVAAAITTGACALIMQWGVIEKNDISLSTYQIHAYLVQGAEQSPGIQYPNYQWGYGRLNLIKSYSMLQGIQ